MYRLAATLAAALIAVPAFAITLETPETVLEPISVLAAEQTDAQIEADLRRVSDALNAITTMKGDFVQISETGGMATGSFYLRKPGRVRFEYDPPAQILFVADGRLISVEDKEMETVNSYPLSATPLKLLLDDDIDLTREAKIVEVFRQGGQLHVKARADDGLAEGELTMVFSEPDLELRQWVILDAQDVETTVALRNVEYGMKLSASLFRPTDYDFENVRD